MASGSTERDRLLGLIREYVFEHGIVNLSLSGLARGVGSNNRMLLYHFGSLEKILASAIDDILENGPLMKSIVEQLNGHGSTLERFASAWRQVSRPERLPYVRIFFARLGMASEQPNRYQIFLTQSRERWVRIVSDALEADGGYGLYVEEAAVAIVSLWRGLQVQLIAGDPSAMIDRVHDAALPALLGIRHDATGESEPTALKEGNPGLVPVSTGQK